MKRPATSRLLAAALLLSLLPASARAAKPLPDGFRDLKWRAKVAPGMKLQKDVSAGDNAAYVRLKDSKKMLGATLESITYGYYKGELASVTIQADAGQGDKLLKALTAEYGEPAKSAANVFIWKDESETLIFFRGVGLDSPGSRGELYIVCKPLVEEGNKAERERREKVGIR